MCTTSIFIQERIKFLLGYVRERKRTVLCSRQACAGTKIRGIGRFVPEQACADTKTCVLNNVLYPKQETKCLGPNHVTILLAVQHCLAP